MRGFGVRRLRGVRVTRALLAFGVAGSAVLAPLATRAQTSDLFAGVVDGTFEASLGGWTANAGSVLLASSATNAHGGGHAGRIEATASGLFGAATQYWLVPTGAGATHKLSLWLLADDPRVANIEAELAFIDASGIPSAAAVTPVVSGGYRLVTVAATAPAGTAYVRATVRGKAAAAGAGIYLDDVRLERGPLPPPAPTGPPGSPATPPPTSTPTNGPTPSPTAAATASASGTPTAPPTPRAFETLTNGGFDDGLYGWGDIGADVAIVGAAAQLSSASSSTKYLYQAVRVTPGAWYAGGASLRLGTGVDAAWMRVAWYASDDASGSQLSTSDSPTLTGGDGTTGDVAAGPAQAPASAHSAEGRIMLRPLGSGAAQLTVDNVHFGETTAPPPTATPTSAPTTSGAASVGAAQGAGSAATGGAAAGATAGTTSDVATPRLVAGRAVADAGGAAVAARATSGGGAAASGGRVASADLEGFAPEVLLRITELMPDPAEPGADADFEWIEVTNVGPAPIALAGIELRDNAARLALPDLDLAPGASIVVAGPRATVPGAGTFRPAGGVLNGLANGGDRLALVTADGRVINALSYGSDVTFDDPALPAPGPGRSLRRYFSDDDSYLGFEVSAAPSPGRIEPAPVDLARTPAASPRAKQTSTAPAQPGAQRESFEAGGGSSRGGMLALTGVGGALLAAAGVRHVWSKRGER